MARKLKTEHTKAKKTGDTRSLKEYVRGREGLEGKDLFFNKRTNFKKETRIQK